MTYDDAMRRALDRAPAVSVASARARALGHEVQRARGKHLPTLSVNSGMPSSSGGLARGATASLNLWAAGAIEAQIEQQRAAFESGLQSIQQSCTETLGLAGDAYVSVLRADAVVALWREQLAEFESIQAMVTQIAAVDRGRQIDVEQVLTRKGLVQSALLDAQTLGRQARLQLERLVGPQAEPMEPSLQPYLDSLLPASLADALDRARANNPALSAARFDIEAARRAVDVARGARWPQLNLVANSTRETVGGVRQRDDRVGVQAQWSLFNGGTDYHTERASAEAVEAARARLEEVERVVQLDVSQTWEQIAAARARASQQASQTRPARAVLDANRELFRLGRRSVLDILNAASDVHVVRLAANDAAYEARLRMLRLHAFTGRTLAELRLATPSPCALQAVTLPPSLIDSLSAPN